MYDLAQSLTQRRTVDVTVAHARRSWLNSVLYVAGTSILIYGSVIIGKGYRQPETVISADLNGDGIHDIVVQSHDGERTGFLGTVGGKNYVKVDDAFRDARRSEATDKDRDRVERALGSIDDAIKNAK